MTRKLLRLSVCCMAMIFLMTCLVSAAPPIPPEPTDVIYACYKKVNGQLRIVKDASKCRPSELPISWNQIGPPGPEGPAGTGDLWITRQGSTPVALGDERETEVLSLTVPAGAYAISAKVSVVNSMDVVQAAYCTLSTGDKSVVELAAMGDDMQQVISLLDAETFASETAITLKCFTTGGSAEKGVLAAIEVGSITEESSLKKRR